MNAPVTDPYASGFCAELYRELATRRRPDPLRAASAARRLELARQQAPAGSAAAQLAEWATPTLLLRGQPQPLYDPTGDFDEVTAAPEPRLDPDVAVRAVGDFVGRRREQRQLRQALRGRGSGLVLHGIGGVGKSTLAAQLIAELGEDAGMIVSAAGQTTADALLERLGKALLADCHARGLDEHHPRRHLANAVCDGHQPWSDRLALLGRQLLDREPVLLLLDNFEDNLTRAEDDQPGSYRIADEELAAFLAGWVRAPGLSRVLVTSRYPFPLPHQAERHLATHHLGPLSLAETRKLIWRLPALDALPADDRERAYTDVGGHPRALEYLDALLHGGAARFPDVAARMERALARRGVPQAHRWLAQAGGDLDRALAETVTLAVDDVLLGGLLDQLAAAPLARRLLLGASVYRLPVNRVGLAWQVADEVQPTADPQRDQRLRRITEALQSASAQGRRASVDNLSLTALRRPPVRAPDDLDEALRILTDLGLLAPVEAGDGGEPLQVVHRWTAGELARLAAPADLTQAHHRAARYWRWRVAVWPQSRSDDIAQLLEARFHYHAAGELEEALVVTDEIGQRLELWGAWSWAERLYREVLTWVPARSEWAAAALHWLGIVAGSQGDYDQALDWHRQSLTIREDLGDRPAMAGSYHQLGNLAYRQGDYDQALDRYRQSLTIKEDLGDRAGMAGSYHQLGMIAQNRGDYDQALDRYRQSLTIEEDLGDRAGMAGSYHQLGIIAEERGDYDQALDRYRQALAIFEDLGDRAGMATSYGQLGLMLTKPKLRGVG